MHASPTIKIAMRLLEQRGSLYELTGNTITCALCGLTSHHPDDVSRRYCGRCHEFLDDLAGLALTIRAELARPRL
jgi:ribosomal protein S27AE